MGTIVPLLVERPRVRILVAVCGRCSWCRSPEEAQHGRLGRRWPWGHALHRALHTPRCPSCAAQSVLKLFSLSPHNEDQERAAQSPEPVLWHQRKKNSLLKATHQGQSTNARICLSDQRVTGASGKSGEGCLRSLRGQREGWGSSCTETTVALLATGQGFFWGSDHLLQSRF